jgi:DNA modification methylase
MAADQIGMPEVPVIWTDMDPGRALILMLADNRLAELADNDPEALALVFQELKYDYSGLDITATGYSLQEIGKFIPDGGDAEEDDYDAPEAYQAIEEPITKPGDLYTLGQHRVLCGDATRPEDIRTLMQGKRARLAVTDPPYNVNYDQKDGSPRKEPPKSGMTNNKILNDNMSQADFKRFLDQVMARLFEACGGPVYIFMSCKEWPRIQAAFEEAGGHWSSTIIWNKSNFVLSRKDYHPKFEPILYGWQEPEAGTVPDYEPILYGWREGTQPQHLIERNKSDVWDVKKPGKSIEHPTMKPVELIGEAIKNSSDLGDLVLDPFLGSGTTLIAADQLGRTCYGLELDPKYCDVIVQRWEKQTGQKATRIPGAGLLGQALEQAARDQAQAPSSSPSSSSSSSSSSSQDRQEDPEPTLADLEKEYPKT